MESKSMGDDKGLVSSSSGKKSVKKSPMSKKLGGKTRFQLFDSSWQKELTSVCSSGLLHLNLEDGKASEKENDLVSLDFDGDSDSDENEDLPQDINSTPNEKQTGENLNDEKVFTACGSCNVQFSDVVEQRQHYTLDWHRYNVKRKLNGQEAVSEATFSEMIDDLSSIDGSDDEEETTQVNRLMDRANAKNEPPNSEETPRPIPVTLSKTQKLEKSPKMFFTNNLGQVVTCYKTILKLRQHPSSSTDKNPVKEFLRVVKKSLKITIIMSSGGHFAAAVFDGNTCTNHKTFHSYTVRAKQGGSQGSRDSKSATSHPKSAGASLRRYNEQSFAQHVQDLLESWKSDLLKSDLIFCRAISSNSSVLFGGKNPPLNKDDEKIRTIPFPTKRPTFNEVKRVHSLLTTIHIYDSLESFLTAHSHLIKEVKSNDSSSSSSPSKKKNKKNINRAKSRSPKRKDNPDLQNTANLEESSDNETDKIEHMDQVIDFSELKEYDDSLTPEQRGKGKGKKKSKKKDEVFKLSGELQELLDSVHKNDVELLKNILLKIRESNEQNLNINQPIDSESLTLLHVAAKNNLTDIVWVLLEEGCDPAIKDKSGKYAYNYAESRESRDTFRKFMGQNPEKYDYKKAQVPPPLSEEEERERAEKKKLLNKLKREKEKQKKAERMAKDKETEEQRRFLNLSDREKRALAAEQRILAQCKRNSEKAPVLVRCFECAVDITGKVPFEYNQNVFCTPKCVAAHRKKFPCPLSV